MCTPFTMLRGGHPRAAAVTAALTVAVAVLPGAVLGDNTQCRLPNGSLAGCGPGHEGCPNPPASGPAFHLYPFFTGGGGGNDPCAPIYDPKHKIYHMFYQDHLAAPTPSTIAHHGGGPIWGHFVSHDLIRWARAPVAIWNDLPFVS